MRSRRHLAITGILTIFLATGTGCGVLKVSDARQKPQEALLESWMRTRNTTQPYRLASLYDQIFYGEYEGSVNHFSEILEFPSNGPQEGKWHSEYSLQHTVKGVADGKPYAEEYYQIDNVRYEKNSTGVWYKFEKRKPIGDSNYKLTKYWLSSGLAWAIKKADVKFAGEEKLDGVACVVFEFAGPGPNLQKNPHHKIWVALSDGLFRKILVEGENDLYSGQGKKASETLTFTYNDKNIKVAAPI